jgi:predicted amidophosphoribosyltransferase
MSNPWRDRLRHLLDPFRPRPTHCADCGKPLDDHAVAGYCVQCIHSRRNDNPGLYGRRYNP